MEVMEVVVMEVMEVVPPRPNWPHTSTSCPCFSWRDPGTPQPTSRSTWRLEAAGSRKPKKLARKSQMSYSYEIIKRQAATHDTASNITNNYSNTTTVTATTITTT